MRNSEEIEKLRKDLLNLISRVDSIEKREDVVYERYSKKLGEYYSNAKILVREQWLTTFSPPFKIGQKIEEGIVVERLVHEVKENGVTAFFVWKFIVVDDNEKKSDLFCWGNGKRITIEELERRKGLL